MGLVAAFFAGPGQAAVLKKVDAMDPLGDVRVIVRLPHVIGGHPKKWRAFVSTSGNSQTRDLNKHGYGE